MSGDVVQSQDIYLSFDPRTNGGLHFIHQEVLEKLRKFNIVPNNLSKLLRGSP